jgi:hypothetical protein
MRFGRDGTGSGRSTAPASGLHRGLGKSEEASFWSPPWSDEAASVMQGARAWGASREREQKAAAY